MALLGLWLGGGVIRHPLARAHETDNFSLPVEGEFADLGEFLDTVHTRAIEEAVREVNAGIERALRVKHLAERAKQLARGHDPDAIAQAVCRRFNDAFIETFDVEDVVRGRWARRAYPDQRTAYWDANWMFAYVHFPIDPRRLVLLFQASTVKAYGVYFGTDKLLHFHHMGRYYYEAYRDLVRAGKSPADAQREVVRWYAGSSMIAENAMVGFLASGVYSNADLCSNFMGFKFLLNLTEPVTLKRERREPLVVRCGVFWRVNDHVRPRAGWFGAFVSDHWNEALNPSLYDVTIRASVRGLLRRRADRIVDFYTRKDGRPADAEYFNQLARTLATCDGEEYGHSGQFEDLMTLGNTCLPAIREPAAVSGGP
jgi:hypothetical protein